MAKMSLNASKTSQKSACGFSQDGSFINRREIEGLERVHDRSPCNCAIKVYFEKLPTIWRIKLQLSGRQKPSPLSRRRSLLVYSRMLVLFIVAFRVEG